jgi:peptidyl-prolyl cis-trans isomerase D
MAKSTLADTVKRTFQGKSFNFKTFTALILFGIICLTFVFFNDMGRGLGGGLGSVATVNNRFITAADLAEEVTRLERSYSGFLGGNMGEMQRQFLQQQGLEFLIQGELLSQYAEKNGIYASDEEIRQIIMTELPYFQENGQFRRERYEAILNANRMTPAGFEEKLRKDRKVQHLRQVFELSSSPMNLEKSHAKELEKTQIKYQFVKLDKAQVAQKMSLSESEVTEKLKDPAFAKRVEDFFTTNSKEYDQAEEVRAAHILIKFDKDVPDSEAKSKAKIEAIQKRLAKEDFGKVAAEVSEDLGSKVKKGDLGFFTKGRMVPEFEAAAFGQKVGEVSSPVRSEFGYHLIKVLEKKEAKTATVDQFRSKIARQLINEERFDTQIKVLEEQMKENKVSEMETTLKNLGLSWQETGFVGLGADKIPGLDSPEALKATTELNPGRKMSHLVRDGGQKWIVKIKEITNKDLASTDMEAQKERGTERLTRWVDQIKKTAKIERHFAADGKALQF